MKNTIKTLGAITSAITFTSCADMDLNDWQAFADGLSEINRASNYSSSYQSSNSYKDYSSPVSSSTNYDSNSYSGSASSRKIDIYSTNSPYGRVSDSQTGFGGSGMAGWGGWVNTSVGSWVKYRVRNSLSKSDRVETYIQFFNSTNHDVSFNYKLSNNRDDRAIYRHTLKSGEGSNIMSSYLNRGAVYYVITDSFDFGDPTQYSSSERVKMQY